ncbi:Ctr copper transporter family-domain-containing protein [Cladorrhinum samala]|uniref:Copper transport protein n=1 Tax=Cladorrhinum samala TaxID=585594 RepID=A0AAV9HT35_9PEZI|nr:Ctr copper transporter family-domain-containing protein [Cladorrhinum samala]
MNSRISSRPTTTTADPGLYKPYSSLSPCEAETLWNWNTVDACFIGRAWQVRSGAMFAATCVGTVMLTFALEFFRRMSKIYDKHIVTQHEKDTGGSAASRRVTIEGGEEQRQQQQQQQEEKQQHQFRPGVCQQAVRALLFLSQVVTAYVLILLAVSFNGFILLSIFLGSLLSFFAFQWDAVPVRGANKEEE